MKSSADNPRKAAEAERRRRDQRRLASGAIAWVVCSCKTPGCAVLMKITTAQARYYGRRQQDLPRHCRTCRGERRRRRDAV